MKRFKFGTVLLALTTILLITVCGTAVGRFEARRKIDLGRFIKEIMIIKVDGAQMNSAIWLPFEFNVQASVSGGKSIAEAQKELEFLKSYLIFMVQSSQDRPGSQPRYATEAETLKRAVLKCRDGSTVAPIKEVPEQLSRRLETLKSVMANSTRGSKNMHILVFPFKDSRGNPIINASQRDKLELLLRGKGIFNSVDFVWHTPFEAIFEGGICPRCGEHVKAKWSYCPWCGNKL